MGTIKDKLLAFMIFFIIISLAITTYFSTTIASNVLKSKVNESNQAALEVYNKYVDSFKINTESLLNTLAESDTLTKA
ncbi:chemotaxis protein (plasmid) [Thermoanaerobacterium thermosaccharolyticum]|uniref:chemotaxis protein n=1 Tax=Thermoanaerobacterium thermosaccharolyticum TaxID=1517 RepID=UPI003DA9239B